MSPLIIVTSFLTVVSLYKAAAECTTESIITCVQDLTTSGLAVDNSGMLSLQDTAKAKDIITACRDKVPMTKLCLQNILLTCDKDSLVASEADGSVSFLEYLCSDDGLAGLNHLDCLETPELHSALKNCSSEYERVTSKLGGASLKDILAYIIGGDGRDDLCNILLEARLCYAKVTAEYCTLEASLYKDELFQQIVQKVVSFLNCPEPALSTHCSLNPCGHGGSCLEIDPSHTTCVCFGGYTGDKCQLYSGCKGKACVNGGKCTRTAGLCECPPSYTGPLCQVLVEAAPQTHNKDSTDWMKSEAFIAAVVSILVVLLLICIVVFFCARAKRKKMAADYLDELTCREDGGSMKIPMKG